MNLVSNPNYKYDPRHSTDPNVYVPAREPFLAQIREAARIDRETNPAYQRNQRLIRALEEVAA